MPPVNRVVEHVLVDATQHMLHLKGPEGLLGYCTNAGIFGGTIFLELSVHIMCRYKIFRKQQMLQSLVLRKVGTIFCIYERS